MGTSGQATAAEVQLQSSQHEKDLFNLGSGGFRLALADFLKDLGKPGEEPASVRSAFSRIRSDTEGSYDQQAEQLPATAQQLGRQQGMRGPEGYMEGASSNALLQLEASRRSQERAINQQEFGASMQQRDYDLSQILGIAGGGLRSSFGFGHQALDLAGMNNKNPWASSAQGAFTGATSAFLSSGGNGWAALGGMAVGGVQGYFS